MEEEWEWKVEEVGVRGEGGGGECEREGGGGCERGRWRRWVVRGEGGAPRNGRRSVLRVQLILCREASKQ